MNLDTLLSSRFSVEQDNHAAIAAYESFMKGAWRARRRMMTTKGELYDLDKRIEREFKLQVGGTK